jgi:hypothetical protein
LLFIENLALTDQADIEQKLELAEHVKNETLALISLAKYRYLRRTYNQPAAELEGDPFGGEGGSRKGA